MAIYKNFLLNLTLFWSIFVIFRASRVQNHRGGPVFLAIPGNLIENSLTEICVKMAILSLFDHFTSFYIILHISNTLFYIILHHFTHIKCPFLHHFTSFYQYQWLFYQYNPVDLHMGALWDWRFTHIRYEITKIPLFVNKTPQPRGSY